MLEYRFESARGNRTLDQVYEGMAVYDRTGRKVGTVDFVYVGEWADTEDDYSQGQATSSALEDREVSLIEDFARAIALTEQIPDALHERLLRYGFMKISSIGLFAASRYVMPDQIASVSDQGVALRVGRDELMKA